ncbi:MAG: hypothetical protein ABI685_05095 [Ferruginibacter sp.]
MKRILLIFSLLFTLQTGFAQTSYFKGEWTALNKNDLFTGLFKIEIKKDGTAKAEFIWTYLATDSNSTEYIDMYKDKKGRSGIEYASGNFMAATNDLYFEGKEKDDPLSIIGLDKYHLKLSINKQVLYGTTETEGTNQGLFYAIKMNNTTGEKEFRAAKSKIKN